MQPKLPRHAPGLRIGLFGGSFNPPHAGHRLVTTIALRRLKLDRVWWIVTPGNPLKEQRGLAPQSDRIAAARRLMPEPMIDVTGFEAKIGTRYTLDTLRYLKRRCPDVRFVWIMGADNLRQFHRWQGWREIARLMPIAVIDRPGATLKATASRSAHALGRWRVGERALLPPLQGEGRGGVRSRLTKNHPLPTSPLQGEGQTPRWTLIHGPRSMLSSSALRQRG